MSVIEKLSTGLGKVVVAVEPGVERSTSFIAFSGIIRKFQDHGLLPGASVVSIIHSSLFMQPSAWYHRNETRYVKETRRNIDQVCAGKFKFGLVDVIKGEGSSNQVLVEQLSRQLKNMKTNLLIVSSNNRSGLPYWVLGSFSETLALTSSAPVMVIKPQVKDLTFSSKPRVVLAVDASVSYPPKYLKWISQLALPAGAHVDLVYVQPKPQRSIFLKKTPGLGPEVLEALRTIENALSELGLKTSLNLLRGKDSTAQSIADYAEKKKAWAILTIAAPVKLKKRLLMGSTARRVLTLTKRPFISLRLD